MLELTGTHKDGVWLEIQAGRVARSIKERRSGQLDLRTTDLHGSRVDSMDLRLRT